ncbi:MAG: hypothetical protein CMJ81_20965 [Planctomycetaceae bacterium]|nr:hypothetical protein [Planctomycetaceae bacterium]
MEGLKRVQIRWLLWDRFRKKLSEALLIGCKRGFHGNRLSESVSRRPAGKPSNLRRIAPPQGQAAFAGRENNGRQKKTGASDVPKLLACQMARGKSTTGQ